MEDIPSTDWQDSCDLVSWDKSEHEFDINFSLKGIPGADWHDTCDLSLFAATSEPDIDMDFGIDAQLEPPSTWIPFYGEGMWSSYRRHNVPVVDMLVVLGETCSETLSKVHRAARAARAARVARQPLTTTLTLCGELSDWEEDKYRRLSDTYGSQDGSESEKNSIWVQPGTCCDIGSNDVLPGCGYRCFGSNDQPWRQRFELERHIRHCHSEPRSVTQPSLRGWTHLCVSWMAYAGIITLRHGGSLGRELRKLAISPLRGERLAHLLSQIGGFQPSPATTQLSISLAMTTIYYCATRIVHQRDGDMMLRYALGFGLLGLVAGALWAQDLGIAMIEVLPGGVNLGITIALFMGASFSCQT